jgi:hypothetical protein
MTDEACPHCGQRMLVRHGVRLTPQLASVFDLISDSRDRGVVADVLSWVFHPNKTKRAALRCVYTDVSRLNDLLEESDYAVRAAGRFEPYKIVKVR